MADDNVLAGLAGFSSGVRDVLVPWMQGNIEEGRQRRLLKEKRESDFEDFKLRLPYEEESKIRIERAKPRTPFQLVDEDTGEAIGIPMFSKPVGLAKNQTPRQTEQEKLDARANAKRQAGLPKSLKSFRNANANLQSLVDSIDDLLNDPNLSKGSGMSGAIMGRLPATKARDIKAKIDTIKSKTSLNALQELRDNSPTGGALGNMSDAEGKRLEDKVAALDTGQSDESFVDQLNKLKRETNSTMRRLREGFQIDYPDFDIDSDLQMDVEAVKESDLKIGGDFKGMGKIKAVRWK